MTDKISQPRAKVIDGKGMKKRQKVYIFVTALMLFLSVLFVILGKVLEKSIYTYMLILTTVFFIASIGLTIVLIYDIRRKRLIQYMIRHPKETQNEYDPYAPPDKQKKTVNPYAAKVELSALQNKQLEEVRQEIEEQYNKPSEDGSEEDEACEDEDEEEEEVLEDEENDEDEEDGGEDGGEEETDEEFEMRVEQENLLILQENGGMETGTVTEVESVTENYDRIGFAVKTFDGTVVRYAAAKKNPKYVLGSAHYIMLDKDDEDRCAVL